MKKFDPSLYFITDSTNYTEEEFLYRVEQALIGGATFLQLREKNKSTREYIQLAEKVHTIAKRYNVPLIIDDRVDVALAIDAEGVHVGAEDMPIATARKLMGDDKIVGATAKTVPWAKEAYEQGALPIPFGIYAMLYRFLRMPSADSTRITLTCLQAFPLPEFV